MDKRTQIAEIDPETLFLDEPWFDEAIMGYVEGACGPIRAVYDQEKVIDILTSRFGDETTALEWYEYNMCGAYLGPQTPVYFIRLNDPD